MTLDILFQDADLVAIDKPAGHLVHPADAPKPDDLVAMKLLRDQLGTPVYTLHRLDRPTCGVLLFGIDRKMAKLAHESLEAHRWKKRYLAVVEGEPPTQWTCEEPIRRNPEAPARDAVTDFRTITRQNGLTLIEARPKTGRFHQIRQHLKHAGHPIVGDYRYGEIDRWNVLGEQLGTGSRMLLQARELRVPHPRTDELLTVEAPDDEAFIRAGFSQPSIRA